MFTTNLNIAKEEENDFRTGQENTCTYNAKIKPVDP